MRNYRPIYFDKGTSLQILIFSRKRKWRPFPFSFIRNSPIQSDRKSCCKFSLYLTTVHIRCCSTVLPNPCRFSITGLAHRDESRYLPTHTRYWRTALNFPKEDNSTSGHQTMDSWGPCWMVVGSRSHPTCYHSCLDEKKIFWNAFWKA